MITNKKLFDGATFIVKQESLIKLLQELCAVANRHSNYGCNGAGFQELLKRADTLLGFASNEEILEPCETGFYCPECGSRYFTSAKLKGREFVYCSDEHNIGCNFTSDRFKAKYWIPTVKICGHGYGYKYCPAKCENKLIGHNYSLDSRSCI